MALDPSIILQSQVAPGWGDITKNATKTAEQAVALKQAANESQLTQLKTMKAKNDVMVGLLGSATDQASYDNAKQQATGMGIDVSRAPETYDPQFVKQIAYASLDAKDRLDAQIKQAQLSETQRHNSVDESNTANRTNAMYNTDIPGLGGIGNGVMGGAPPAAPATGIAPVTGPTGVAAPALAPGVSLQPPPVLSGGKPVVADATPASPTSALLPPPSFGAPNPTASPTVPLAASAAPVAAPISATAPQPSASPTTPPGAIPQGKDYLDLLKKQNPALGSMVEAIGNGEQPMPPATTRGGRPNPIALAVNQAYPGMSASDWNVKNAAQKDFFGGGKNSQSISALNTAMQHAGVLLDKVNALHAGNSVDVPAVNAVRNTISSAVGSDVPGNFATAVAPLAQEITSAYRGAGGAEADIQNQIKTIGNANASQKQQVGALNTIVDLMNGRVNSLKDQYDSAMNGTGRQLTVVRPETAAQIAKIKAASAGFTSKATTVPHQDIDAELAKRGVK